MSKKWWALLTLIAGVAQAEVLPSPDALWVTSNSAGGELKLYMHPVPLTVSEKIPACGGGNGRLAQTWGINKPDEWGCWRIKGSEVLVYWPEGVKLYPVNIFTQVRQ